MFLDTREAETIAADRLFFALGGRFPGFAGMNRPHRNSSGRSGV
jgi:hypothetical protein